jgi:hypothetical protein
MADRKVVDETHYPSARRGDGVLRREVWVDERGRVTRYNLAYINPELHGGDNGRVIGYDNAHGRHHRHFLGSVETLEFTSFEDIETRFEQDWMAVRKQR